MNINWDVNITSLKTIYYYYSLLKSKYPITHRSLSLMTVLLIYFILYSTTVNCIGSLIGGKNYTFYYLKLYLVTNLPVYSNIKSATTSQSRRPPPSVGLCSRFPPHWGVFFFPPRFMLLRRDQLVLSELWDVLWMWFSALWAKFDGLTIKSPLGLHQWYDAYC